MSTDPLNTAKAFEVGNDRGHVRSVSVIFMLPSKGYLLCSEMRKGFPNPDIRTHEDHMVGGKVDMTDTSALQCGFREFCEETGFRNEQSSIKETVSTMISKFNRCPTVKWDYCVSPKKGLYNRFYVINIDDCPDIGFLEYFIEYVTTWEKNPNLPLESLFFWNRGETFEHKPSNLLKTFSENLPPDF